MTDPGATAPRSGPAARHRGAGPGSTAWQQWAPGTRVVVRRRLADAAPGGPRLTDVLGEVLRADADGVLVRTRAGDVEVAAADVVLTKVVPPAPPRRAPRR